MAEEGLIQSLLKLSTPKKFNAKEWICYEGQPGEEMYVVLKGKVGIFITSVVNTLIEVAMVGEGDFFGEMAIFDNLPRSASCIAMEDTMCVAVTQDMLKDFIITCPDLAVRLYEKLSVRIRSLNNDLYKSADYAKDTKTLPFMVPMAFCKSHAVEETKPMQICMQEKEMECPVCGEKIRLLNLKRNMLSRMEIDNDRRPHYAECEPMWYEIFHCPYCHYSNHYLKFFPLFPAQAEVVKKLLEEEQKPVINKLSFVQTPFDSLIVHYLQAIHVNEVLNSASHLLIGKMWMNLYWLARDAQDEEFVSACAEKAIFSLGEAYRYKEKLIPDEFARQTIALMLANLYWHLKKKGDALAFCDEAEAYPDRKNRMAAMILRKEIMEKGRNLW